MKNPFDYLSSDLNGLSSGYKKLVIKIYLLVLKLVFTVAFPHLIKGLYFLLTKNKELQYKEFIAGSLTWGNSVIRLTNTHIYYSNKIEIPEKGHIIMLNHINEIDFPFDCIIISKPFLANQAIKSSIFAYWWMSAMGSQVFDTSKQRTIVTSVRNLMEGLKEQSYIVYPEGGNSYSEEIRPLKKGMIKLAYDQKVPVVVVLKAGVTKLQEVQKDLVIGYRNCGILDPANYTTWEEFRDAIHTKMIEDKKILDQEVARETNIALNASPA